MDNRVRQILVERLYAQPSGVMIGATCGVLCAWGAAGQTHQPALTASAAALTAIAILRVFMAFLLPRLKNFDTRFLEVCYEIGAFSYAGLCGILAAQTLSYSLPSSLQTLTVGNAIAYGVAMASRNAGRPAIAIGQLFLTLMPAVIGCALRPEWPFHLLAIALGLTIPAMASITLNTFQVLRDSINAAETAQRLADKMQHLARSDVVTGLLNRAGLNHQLVERVAALQAGQKLALFWLDLDKFKEVNDTLGHQVGDRLLAEVAVRLNSRGSHGSVATSSSSPAKWTTARPPNGWRSACSRILSGRCGSTMTGSKSAARSASR